MQAYHDNRLVVPLSCRTCLGAQHGSYVLNCYAMAVSTSCDEEEPLFVDKAMKWKNWFAAMWSKYDVIMKNGTWSLWHVKFVDIMFVTSAYSF